MPPHTNPLVRRDAFERREVYDTTFRIAAYYEAILRWFGRWGNTPAYLPEILAKISIGDESNRSLGRILLKGG
jgi:hypothetical protein